MKKTERAIKYIASLSGGKDSTAMVLYLLEHNYPLDEIVFIDTGLEFDEMYKHIADFKKYIKEKYNRSITTIKGTKDFEYLLTEHTLERGKRKGEKGYGFPSMMSRWCTLYLKVYPFKAYIKAKYGKNVEIRKYIGIAADETKRCRKDIYPLVEAGLTESQCMKMCKEHGFHFYGLYDHFERTGCWLCPLQSQGDLYSLMTHYPEKWEKLRELCHKVWDRVKSGNKENFSYKLDGRSFEELEERIKQRAARGAFDTQFIVKED